MKIKLPLIALAALFFAGLPPTSSSAYVGVSVAIAPPAIPIYQQPYCPAPGYIWTPGYWAWADFGYYWVPGVWVAPPRIGLLWTPGYWGYYNGRYGFNQGYWGPTVGFYGGINYGHGYVGRGYYGGEWAGNTFRYNTAASRVNTTVIHNTYVNKNVVNTNTGSRAGFNGPGGVQAKPNSREQAAAKVKHVPPTSAQRSRVEAAKKDPALHAANNKGKPKPEAIEALDRNNGRQRAAASENNQGKAKQTAGQKRTEAQKQSDVGNRPGSEKAKHESAQARNRSQPTAQAAQVRKTAPQHADQSAQVKHNTRTNKKAAPRTVQHAQPVGPRPQAVRAPQAPPTAGHGAPARADQPGKKKKKKHGDEQPGDGR